MFPGKAVEEVLKDHGCREVRRGDLPHSDGSDELLS